MLIEKEKLQDQLADFSAEDVQEIYLLLAYAKLPEAFEVRPTGLGFIEKELRFERDGKWYFSAVLNKSWVLWYFRRPALNELGKQADELLQIFPHAEPTKEKEVKLRIRSLKIAYAVLGWVQQNG